MEQLTYAINKKFDNKYPYLKLYELVYDKGLKICSVTFLFPYNMDEPSKEEREELTDFLREFLSLNAKIRLKMKKSFLDEPLIRKEVKNFFETNHKGIFPYIMEDNIAVHGDGFNVDIIINLNKDVLSMLDDASIRNNLMNFLNRRFIAQFNITLEENADELPDEIDYVDVIEPIAMGVKRYDVRVIKKIIGGEIAPKPEYIKNIERSKTSVILAGKISNIAKKAFTIKKGKHQGEEKHLYTFNLTDDASIECVYFCSKTNERKLDALQDGLMLLCVGDIKKGLSGKLTYYPRKLSYASPVEKVEEKPEAQIASRRHKQVVFPEPMSSSEQSNLFNDKPKFSDFILENTIVVFDLETTGLDPEFCEITELGAVKIVNGFVKEKFSSFVKPKNEIPANVTELTHITNEMVANAPPIEAVIQDFYDYTRGCIISGYNIVGFDMKFLQKAAASVGLKFDNQVIDAFIVARQSGLRTGNYKLGTVVKALGLTLVDAHRAYNDAYATALVLLEFNKKK